jgi:hypothetical protein
VEARKQAIAAHCGRKLSSSVPPVNVQGSKFMLKSELQFIQ